jgi:hypothetical protein
MPFADPAGADITCADTIDAGRAQAAIAAASIEVFIVIFPCIDLNKFMFS